MDCPMLALLSAPLAAVAVTFLTIVCATLLRELARDLTRPTRKE